MLEPQIKKSQGPSCPRGGLCRAKPTERALKDRFTAHSISHEIIILNRDLSTCWLRKRRSSLSLLAKNLLRTNVLTQNMKIKFGKEQAQRMRASEQRLCWTQCTCQRPLYQWAQSMGTNTQKQVVMWT